MFNISTRFNVSCVGSKHKTQRGGENPRLVANINRTDAYAAMAAAARSFLGARAGMGGGASCAPIQPLVS